MPAPGSSADDDELPRVPLPALDESCEQFLAWSAPLLDAEQQAATERAVAAFRAPDGPGPRLQAALEAYDARPDVDSWLDEFWRDRYLGRRDRIALNANFFFLLRAPEDAAGHQGQVERAAGLVAGAVDHALRLDAGQVPPVVRSGQAASMAQHARLFAAARLPGRVRDTVSEPPRAGRPGTAGQRHVVVLAAGRAFRMDVIGPSGQPFAAADLAQGLRRVLAASERGEGPPSVGPLTSLERPAWAAAREALLAHDSRNADSLAVVETALLCVCLDAARSAGTTGACDVLLHGGSETRWFDKPVSVVVLADGTAGLNVEHSRLDGTTVLDLVDALAAPSPAPTSQGAPPVEPVVFHLDEELVAAVSDAAAGFREYAAGTATQAISYDVGADAVKAGGMSPDAFVQMAFQLAQARSRGGVGATYESIATRQLHAGRTEAMRVVTPEVLRFVASMEDPGQDAATRREAFRAAAQAHVARAKACRAGDAPEQHLWELQLLAGRQGHDLGVVGPLSLHESPGWQVMRDDVLSTSSAPSAAVEHFGFGSTGPRCLGIAYVLLPDALRCYLSTRAGAAEVRAYADALGDCLRELRALLADNGLDASS